ncbi:thymidine phosphorylase [Ructibacterium gallinarum]|uniref:Pyrimidine-nucleoside phosphorylase n=1 Tax=Ructibacterium gallinarum TaxID=2779355 RepID=A0A9D5M2G2_9FIRM|nr:thymidine phosphorylase [Ructibacterium gallinarum]MBE5039464.1 thymidine phosphorylase [Ructibacterium gallinarum]
MRMVDLIEKKKRGGALSQEELEYFVQGYIKDQIPDYQAAAFSMAIWFQGMTSEETAQFTQAMADSGDQIDLSSFGETTVDKHSSGGVGDKTTLIAAPIAAAAGCVVAKMSGRGLGFTGGTVDKLESIPGFSSALRTDAFYGQAKTIGLVLAGQTGEMVPCDKKLYALRDVTGTVDSLPLIAASIMSKKLAAGAKNLVLDVKCGSGAFMETPQEAEELAKQMVSIATACRRRVTALITDMSTPLGTMVGNRLEVIEAMEVLCGRGEERLTSLSLALASEMIHLGLGLPQDEARNTAEKMLTSGAAMEKLLQAVAAQGGETKYLENTSLFSPAACQTEILAKEDGYMVGPDALMVGRASVLLGAGRNMKMDKIDPAAGIYLTARRGDYVRRGDVVMRLYAEDQERIAAAKTLLSRSVQIDEKMPSVPPLIFKRICGNPVR